MQDRPPYILPLIVFAQFSGTSLWFAGNAILGDLIAEGNELSIGWITSMVQFGFITGTLLFAFLSIADRFDASKVFLASSLLAAATNILVIPFADSEITVALLRFMTGFFLAGIYPVGMKIAADWFDKRLGKALGFLLAALVLGTAFPHLLKAGYFEFSWQAILMSTSLLAVVGGLIIAFIVHEGPQQQARKSGRIRFELPGLFRDRQFRSVALGYFGHMWELYAFWAFLPFMLQIYGMPFSSISLWSFLVISIGSLGCIAGGFLSLRMGNAKVAFISLMISGVCCLTSPLFFNLAQPIFLLILLIWGFTVVPDSPQFSSLIASTAPNELKGTALSVVTGLGFAVTIASIGFLEMIINQGLLAPEWSFIILFPGPLLGLIAMRKGVNNE